MKKYGILLNIILTSIVLLVFLRSIIFNLNSTLFSKGGDGTRAYYSAMYHIKYDSEVFRTKCMNYPYGECAFYTDSQPIISNAIKLIKPIIDLSNYTIGIINFLMILSLLIGSLFIYLLFIKLDVHYLISSLLAIGITFLSPQLDRMAGHFSLSYICFIPMVFYFLYQYHSGKKMKYVIILMIIGIVAAGTHLYLYAMYAFILIIYWIVQIPVIIRGNYIKYGIFILLALIVPIIIYKVILILSDFAHDRPSYPYGFLTYKAYPESVFLPVYKPYLKFITTLFKNSVYIQWEGRSYIGLVASVVSIYLMFRLLFIAIKTRLKFSISISGNSILDFAFICSFSILLFSFGLPFAISGLEQCVEYLGPLRQIRAPGRFAWVFYYASNIIAFTLLYKWRWNFKKINVFRIVFYLSIAILFYESFIKIRPVQEQRLNKNLLLTDYKNSLPESRRISKLNNMNFKAIIPIPFFHAGAEYISAIPSEDLINYTFLVSIKTGIPTTGMIAARSSLSEIRNQFQLISDPIDYPEILNEYEEGNYLIIHDTTGEYTLTQSNLIKTSSFIDSYNQYSFYKISLEELKDFYRKEISVNRVKYSCTYSSLIKDQLHLIPEISLPFLIDTIYSREIDSWKVILDAPFTMPSDTLKYNLGFWIGPFTEDLLLKTEIKMYFTNENDSILYLREFKPHSRVITIYKNNVLTGIQIPYSDEYSNVEIMIRNKRMTNQKMNIKGYYLWN